MPYQFRPPYEVWGNFECAGGLRLGTLPEAQDAEEDEQLDGDTLSLDYPVGFQGSQYVQEGRVIRGVWVDPIASLVRPKEYRIQPIQERRREDGSMVVHIEAQDPRVALNDLTIYRTEADGSHTHTFGQDSLTAAQYLSQLILPRLAAEGYTWVAAGTIDSAAPLSLQFDFTSALDAIRMLAQGLGLEFDFRRSGTTQYLVDLVTQIGSTGAKSYIRYGKNLTSLTRFRDGPSIATLVIPRGADEGGLRGRMQRAKWKVVAVDTVLDDVTLGDPLGGDPPIIEDDQYNGRYLRRMSGTLDAITDTFLASQKVRVADASFYTVGDLVEFRKNSSGEELDWVESPLYGQAAPAAYGLRAKVLDRPDITGTLNELANPALRLYTTASNAPPDGCSVIPGCGLAVANIDKETNAQFWRVGGASAKVQASTDGQGMEWPYASISPTDKDPYFSGFAGYKNITDGGRVRIAIVLGKATVSISGTPTRTTSGGITTVSVTTSGAHGLAVGGDLEVLGITGGTIADGYNGIRKVSRVTGPTQLEYQLTSDPGTVSVSGATIRPVFVYKTAGEAASQTWVDLAIKGINAKEVNAVVGKVQVMQDGSAATTFYVDRAQLTQTPEQRAFAEGSGGTRLAQEALRYLKQNRQPPVRYETGFVDLGRLDPKTWPFEEVIKGAAAAIDDPDFPIAVQTRIVRVRRKPFVDTGTAVELSTRFEDLTDRLARPPRPPVIDPSPPKPRRNVIEVPFQAGVLVPESPTDFTNLRYNFASGGSNPGLYPNSTTPGIASGSIAEALRAYGPCKIIGWRSDLQQLTAGVGTLRLYRDASVLSTLTAGADAMVADWTVSQVVGNEAYWVRASLAQVSVSIFPFFTQFWITIEVDERVASA